MSNWDLVVAKIKELRAKVPSQYKFTTTEYYGYQLNPYLNFLASLLAPIAQTYLAILEWKDQLDIDTCTGVWLDRIGELVGLARPGINLDSLYIFAFEGPGGSQPTRGFYDADNNTGGRLQFNEGLKDPSGGMLGDTEYRQLLKAKIWASNNAGSVEDLMNFIIEGMGIQDMTFDWETPGVLLLTLASEIDYTYRRMIEQESSVVAGIKVRIVNWPEPL